MLLKFLVAIITSFYLFPFQFTFLPAGYNTKKILALVGLFVLFVHLAKLQRSEWRKDLFMLSLYAGLVSFWGIFSVIVNETFDYTYASYIVSMWVWLGGAYSVVTFMKWVHGRVTMPIFCNYLLAVCVGQCALALMIDFYSPLQSFINSFYEEADYFVKNKRLYGLGASLDVAGSRFSAVLVMLTVLLVKWKGQMRSKILIVYLFSLFLVAVIGNMIARTTIVGVIISLLYFIYAGNADRDIRYGNTYRRIMLWVIGLLCLGLPVWIYLYYTNQQIHDHLRFAFEGFFSLVEKGTWEVHSNDRLGTMIVFPETLKTWVIGDGYFNSPLSNPYYTGVARTEYYMGTDIGYLRFIFYFGVLGLLSFVLFFLRLGTACMKRFPNSKPMFVLLLIINFAVWFKVSTDIFVIFALFLCLDSEEIVELNKTEDLESNLLESKKY